MFNPLSKPKGLRHTPKFYTELYQLCITTEVSCTIKQFNAGGNNILRVYLHCKESNRAA